ncbi:MAG: S-ribosylhomocysteine lyase [Fusobacteria bacterium]|nr:S-ribosylhomocysteine lyase [Fusobacteriota bacterium]
MPLVDSFTVDHKTMRAPQVRKAKVIKRESGEIVEVYDLRFKKPNTTYMNTKAVHTLEHFLATFLREKLPDIIDVSPMGCRTGFYMTLFGSYDEREIEEYLIYSLNKILEAEKIPGSNEEECGNFEDHSLEEAKEVAKEIIEGLKK